eukprot:scaffold144617_cov31-Prasinocladus_malaysianus.AAC.1
MKGKACLSARPSTDAAYICLPKTLSVEGERSGLLSPALYGHIQWPPVVRALRRSHFMLRRRSAG